MSAGVIFIPTLCIIVIIRKGIRIIRGVLRIDSISKRWNTFDFVFAAV